MSPTPNDRPTLPAADAPPGDAAAAAPTSAPAAHRPAHRPHHPGSSRTPGLARRLAVRVALVALAALLAAPAQAGAPPETATAKAAPGDVATGDANDDATGDPAVGSTPFARAGDATPPGDTDPDSAPTARFEQRMTVTATAPAITSEERFPGRELETGASVDAVEHLRGHPGLAAARRGPINLDPQVRGLVETQVATLVDGTRTFAAGPGRMDSGLSHVNPHAVEAVEVVKGPYALTWGAGALSAIRFQTRRAPFAADGFRWTGEAGARYGGNASTRDLFAHLSGGGPRFRFTLLAGDRTGDDYETGGGETVPADFDSTEARLHLGFQATDGLLLEVDGGYQDQQDVEYAGRLLDATYFKTRSYAGRLTWAPAVAAVDEVAVLAYSNRKDHLMNNDGKPTARPMPGRMPPFALDVHLPTESNTAGGRLAVEGRRGGLAWTAGGDLYRVEQDARRTIARRDTGMVMFRDVAWPDARLEDGGVFLQGRTARERLTVAGTVRYDRWSAEARDRVTDFFAATAGPPRPRDEDLWSAAVSGRLALGDGGASSQFLSFGLGRAVRTPTAQELYSDRFPSTRFQVAAEFLGDPGLEPETSLQADLGWRLQGTRLTVAVDAFVRRLDDYVTVQPDPTLPRRLPMSPPVVFRYVNGSRADFVGAEATLDARLATDWRLRGTASWIRGEDRERDEPVFGLAPFNVGAAVRWQPSGDGVASRLWAEAGIRHAEPQDRVATSRLERPTPAWTVVDLAAGYRWGDWQVGAGVDNVLDEDHADHLNSLDPFTGERISEPGRSWFVRAEVGF